MSPAPLSPRQYSVRCLTPAGLHRMAYVEWGDPDNPRVLICAHGLTRSGRDFDFLAQALTGEYRVVCPDVAGRGASGWLKNPMLYVVPTYAADMVTLIARLGAEEVHWVGTSMGGLIGMGVAALSDTPITRLVLNDVGPVLTFASLARIGTYVGKDPVFPSIEAAELFVRFTSAPFGPHSDAEWRFLTNNVVRRQPDGSWRMHYDPAIAVPFTAGLNGQDLDLWAMYDAVRCPTLVLRDQESDLLTPATAAAMEQRGPRARCVEFPGVGHAPTLIHEDQIAVVRDFLLGS